MKHLLKVLIVVLFQVGSHSSFAQSGIQGLTNYYDPCCSGGNISILDWAPEDDNGDLITVLADLSLASNNASTCDAAMPPGALIDTDGSGTPDAIDPCQLAINTSYCLTVYYNGDFAKVNVNKKDNPVIVGSGITVELCEADIDGDAGTGLTAFYELDNLLDLVATSSRDNPVDEVWTSADGTVNNFDEFEHSYTGNNTSKVLTVNYSTGSTVCDINQDFNITVFKASDASWTNPGPFCVSASPENWSADVTVAPGDQGDLDAQWTISSGTITSNRSDATFTPSTAGDYDVTYTVGFGSTGNGCRVSEMHTVVVESAMDATWTATTPICDAAPIDLDQMIADNGGTPGGVFTYVSGGGNAAAISNTGNDYEFDGRGLGGTAASPVTVTLNYELGAGTGCGDDQNSTFTLLASPDAQWNTGITDVFCMGDVSNQSLAGYVDPTSASQGTVTYSDMNGVVNGAGTDIQLSAFPACTGGTNTTATIDLTVDNGTCADTESRTFTRKCVDTSWTNPGPFCINELPVNILNLSNPAVTTGGSFDAHNDVSSNMFAPSSPGVSQVYYEITDADCGLFQTATKGIVVVDTASASVLPFVEYGCLPATLDLEATPAGGTYTYEWLINGSVIGTGATYQATFTDSGTHVVTLRTTNTENGASCVSERTLTPFRAIMAPQALGSASQPKVLINSSLQFTNTSNSFADSIFYTWYWDDGNPIDTVLNKAGQSYTFLEERDYNIVLGAYYAGDPVLESDPGCMDSIIIPVFVTSEVIIHFPSAFSPLDLATVQNTSPCALDGDYHNDCFGPIGSLSARNVNSFEFIVFNRYGDALFKTDDYTGRWDGTYNDGTIAPPDIYAYMLRITDNLDQEFKVSGTFMLLR